MQQYRLSEICVSISDGDHLAPPKSEVGIPFVTISDFSGNDIDFSDTMYVPESYYDKLDDKRKAQKDDILYSVVGSFGIPVFIKQDNKFCFQRHIAILRPDKRVIVPKYLYYTMKSPGFYSQADSCAVGVAQRTISLTSLRNMKISIPSMSVQNAVASILSAYDSQIENNQKRIKFLEQMAENLYKEWFVRFRFPGYETAKFERGLPKGWEYKKLTKVADIIYGYPFNSSLFCSDSTLYPVVRIRDIAEKHTETFTSEKPDEKYLIHINDLLIGMDGIFHMNIWTNEGDYLNQRVVKISSKEHHLSNLFLFYSISPQVKMLESIIAGTTVAHLSAKDMNKMTVLVPDDTVLELCFSKFESILSMRKSLLVQNDLLTSQRDLLLPRLMSGKLSI